MNEAAQRMRDLRAAEMAFRAALDQDGGDGTALKGLAALLAATGRADEAVVLLRARLRQAPEDDAAWRVLGMALCRQADTENTPERKNRCFSEAGEALRGAVARAGWDVETAASLAASLAGLGRRMEALRVLSEALGHVLQPPAARLRLYAEALLLQVIWELPGEAARTAGLMRHEATGDPDALEGELLRLAREARRMAGAGQAWRERALLLAGLLEELSER